jgi:lysophospholipase L1-like esterase
MTARAAALTAALALTFAAAPSAPSAAAAAAPASDTPVTFVALGDSLTSGYMNPGPAWPVELDRMRADMVLLHNAGVPGDTTAQMLARVQRDVYAYNPQMLFIFAGVNDLGTCVTVPAIVANIKKMIDGAYENGVGRIVLILNSHDIPMNAYNGHQCGPMVQAGIDELDAAVTDFGISTGIQTIDLRPVLDVEGRYDPKNFVADGVHFNPTGVDIICRLIDGQLSRGFDRYLRGPS